MMTASGWTGAKEFDRDRSVAMRKFCRKTDRIAIFLGVQNETRGAARCHVQIHLYKFLDP